MSDDDLRNLYFGKDDAESDMAPGGLLRQGFLKTAAYEAAKAGKKSLIIGRKGSGKSAICMRLRAEATDGIAASLVTPDEISAEELRRFVLAGIPSAQSKALVWRYVLAVQSAKFAVAQAIAHDVKSESIAKVRAFLVENGELEDLRFHEKFWRVIERIKSSISLEAFGAKVSVDIQAPAEGLRVGTEVEALERYVATALSAITATEPSPRLLLLVDQIEKVWSNDRDSDDMVIGLLMASKHIAQVFSCVVPIVFLRRDIYDLLQFQDRDKFRGDEMHIDWTEARLVDLAHSRAQVSLGRDIDSNELWRGLFVERMGDYSIERYLVNRTLMRPRDLIQLCNACRDAAEKNGRSKVSRADVREATIQYSNWKLQDLANEYLVNFPFLGDLYVLFQNSGYLVTRNALERRLATLSGALAARYPDHARVFTFDTVLAILYDVGFLGVLRKGVPAYVFEDPNRIEPHETQLLIHPCFRESLRSTSSVDIRPYEPAELERRFRSLAPVRGSAPIQTRRGLRRELATRQQCRAVLRAVAGSSLPDLVQREIATSVELMMADAEEYEYLGGPWAADEWAARVLRYLGELEERLVAMQLLGRSSADLALRRALQGVLDESEPPRGLPTV